MGMLDGLRPNRGARHRRKRVGRGPGSGRGKTSTRGVKGQGKRSAGRETPFHFEGGQMPLVRRLPKHGFRRPGRVECEIVNVGRLAAFGDGATVDREALVRQGLVRASRAPVKLLAEGEAPRNLVVRVEQASAAARQKIEAAGGRVEILA
jgi:large subunit ribosomal protein L15